MNLVLPPWARWGALILAALFLYMFGRMDGQRIEGAKHLAYVASQATQAVKIARAQEKIVTKTEIRYRDRIQVIQQQGDALDELIAKLITADTDARYRVPVGFVRVHRAATTGEPAGSPGELDGAASDIALSAVAETDAHNYTECRKWREQVEGWQTFYTELKAATTTPPRHP